MTETLLGNEAAVRLGFFFGVLVLMAAWEAATPRRERTQTRALRWTSNLGIVVVNTLLVRLLFPVLPVALALIADDRGWGLFNIVDAPTWLAVVLSVVLLDLLIYGQHVLVHFVPVLWRLHRMHHADLDIDVTTGARFHPLEIIFSILIKMVAVAVLGAPAAAVNSRIGQSPTQPTAAAPAKATRLARMVNSNRLSRVRRSSQSATAPARGPATNRGA